MYVINGRQVAKQSEVSSKTSASIKRYILRTIYLFTKKYFSPFSNADFWNNFQHFSWISLELVNFTVTYSSQFGDERPNDLVSALKHWHTVATDSQSTALSYSNILVLYLSFCIAFNHLNASISCHDGVHLWKKCIFFNSKNLVDLITFPSLAFGPF